jgi:tagatose 6-phosphate kinase
MITSATVTGLARRVTIGTVTLNAAIDKRYVVDSLTPGSVVRVRECTCSAGGKGLNVSRVARLAGAGVVATGYLAGHAGCFIAEQIRALGVDDAFVEVPGESRSCINVVTRGTGETTELLEPGIEVTGADGERLRQAHEAMLDRVDVVTLSGSAPRGCPPEVYGPLVGAAREAGRPVIVDTSGAFLSAAVRSGPSVVKPNVAEARGLVGGAPAGPDDPVTLGRALVAGGVESAVISRGADGAVLVTASGAIEARPPEAAVVNTVGCGDAMVAALAIGLAAAIDPVDLITMSVAVASAASMSPGTGSFTMADLDHILDGGVRTRQIS